MTSLYQLKDLNLHLDFVIKNEFDPHPFYNITTYCNYEKIMRNYLAMSQAFPFLQAGSQKDIFWPYMENNQDVTESVELTSVVGIFLCWDETGGLYPTIDMGLKALPKILATNRLFHSNILKKDCSLLFGKSITPDYSSITKNYLINLYKLLSSSCAITRVASMVSFENHANKMILALWDNISSSFPSVKTEELNYFRLHVGGNDPAEKYHVLMTNNLINKIVPQESLELFFKHFTESYSLHYNWCKDIIKLSEDVLLDNQADNISRTCESHYK